jgi:hypothetical protein
MSSRLGPLEIECDAPSYSIVCACRELGLESPEDVRWRRLSRFRREWKDRKSLFVISSWTELLGRHEARPITCSCGLPLPALETYSFLFASGGARTYQLGQCRRCHAIFWDEA